MNVQMTTASWIRQFVHDAKAHDIADPTIVALLRLRGWSERRAYAAIGDYYAERYGLPSADASNQGSDARDAFFYLLNFITLGTWTTALGQIFYDLIARRFPDASSAWSEGHAFGISEIAWQLAVVVIAFPIYAFVANRIHRDERRRREAPESGVRSWLTYVALVIAAIVVITDGIWFVGAVLLGGLSIRFVLDSLVLLVLGGGVFTYYLLGLSTTRHGQASS